MLSASTPAVLANDELTSKVFVGDLGASAGKAFCAVIIPAMVEGQFPQTVRQDPLLFDSERQHLSEVLLAICGNGTGSWKKNALPLP